MTKSAQAKKLARASAQAQEPFELRRLRSEVASLVVDPKRPRVAAGGQPTERTVFSDVARDRITSFHAYIHLVSSYIAYIHATQYTHTYPIYK